MSPKELADRGRKSEETVSSWLKQAGIAHHKTPNPSAQWALLCDLPAAGNLKLEIVRPREATMIGVGVNINVAPEHVAIVMAMNDEQRTKLIVGLRKIGFAGGDVGFVLRVDSGVPAGWTLDTQVFDDGLTQDRFMSLWRKLISKHLEIVDEFNSQIGFRAQRSSTAGGPSMYH